MDQMISLTKTLPLRINNALGRFVSKTWKPYSRIFLVGDSARWVLNEEAREVAKITHKLGYHVANSRWVNQARQQVAFYSSQFILIDGTLDFTTHRIATTYFHGRPGEGYPQFDQVYNSLCKYHQRISRIQVSHSEIMNLTLTTGILPEKVHLIPIGINPNYFQIQTPEKKIRVRNLLGIPQSAVVIGSFQKDGTGWGEGFEPKLIKGPDVFLKAVEILKTRVPEVYVLLTGPARGYVQKGLEHIGVPYHHEYPKKYAEVGDFFQALDVYIISSRQEGGPKAVLESMASGIPLVTTRVGQAMDLVRHGQNGWMVDVEDAPALAHWAEYAISNRDNLGDILCSAKQTANANSYEAQIPLWECFMRGFIEKWIY